MKVQLHVIRVASRRVVICTAFPLRHVLTLLPLSSSAHRSTFPLVVLRSHASSSYSSLAHLSEEEMTPDLSSRRSSNSTGSESGLLSLPLFASAWLCSTGVS